MSVDLSRLQASIHTLKSALAALPPDRRRATGARIYAELTAVGVDFRAVGR